MAITTYLFDLDGTLIDTAIYGLVYEPIMLRLEKLFSFSRSELEEKIVLRGLVKTPCGRFDTGDVCREFGCLEMYYEELEKVIGVNSVLHDTVLSVFEMLKKRGVKIGIVSNSMRRTILLYVDKYGLGQFVDFVFSRDDAGCKKKSDTYWTTLIEKFKLNSAECVMVGDDVVQDIEMAAKFGFKTLHVTDASVLPKVLF